MRSSAFALGVFLALAAVSSPASAQRDAYRLEPPAEPPSEDAMQAARALFAEGAAFVEQGRWADALRRFEDAYRRSGVPAALFNVGTTLRSMGRHRDARDAFAQLLDVDELDDETRATATERRAEEAARVARLELAGLEGHPAARVLLDGLEVHVRERSLLALETDPGRHGVLVEEEGYTPWQRELDLADGERVRLTVSLLEIPSPPPEIIVERRSEQLWESPVFWTIVGLVLAGAGAGLAAFLYDDAQLDPRPGFLTVVTP